MKNRLLFCIVQPMPDGINYYCGLSKIPLGNKWAVGLEWSLNKDDAERFIDIEAARKELKQYVIQDNPFARIEPIEPKNF